MTKILILGGYGYAGRLLARYILEQTNAEIILAGRHLEKAREYAERLNSGFKGGRVSAVRADAADGQSMREALNGTDLVLVASPTTKYANTVIRTAIESGVDYLDIQLDARKFALLKSLAPEIEHAGLCFITEAGFHPGLPAAMIRYAASYLDRLDTATTAGYLNMGSSLPYSEAIDELMEAFRNYQAQVFKDGQWTKPGSYDVRQIDFGEPIGARKCFSMFFEELRPLPEIYPTLKSCGFYISGSHWILDWVITPLVIMGLKIAPKRGTKPLGKLMWWGMQAFQKPPYIVMLKVEARGEKDGKMAKIETVISHPNGYELTAIPVVACLMQYLDGSARCPGLWMMGHLVEPMRAFRDMEKMGVRMSTTVI